MLKKILIILIIPVIAIFQACEEPERVAGFEDVEELSIYNYILLDYNLTHIKIFRTL